MRKLKLLLVLLLAVLLVPFAVHAEGEEDATLIAELSQEVNVYLFRGEGCPHCAEAEEWFASIEDQYGDKFQIVDYEVWNNQENSKLMDRVAKARGEEAEGVPYIIIGNKSWFGYAADYNEEIIGQIESEYEQDPAERYDIIRMLPDIEKDQANKKKSTGSDVLALIIILVVAGGAGFGIYKARVKVQ